jgi:hypothetical protein
MSTAQRIALALGLFGLAVIGSGLFRYLTDPGGQNGLYFGLVMGGIALAGALLAAFNQILAARLVGGLGIAFVLLWFGYDLFQDLSRNFVITGTEIRKSLILAAGVVAALVIYLPGKRPG